MLVSACAFIFLFFEWKPAEITVLIDKTAYKEHFGRTFHEYTPYDRETGFYPENRELWGIVFFRGQLNCPYWVIWIDYNQRWFHYITAFIGPLAFLDIMMIFLRKKNKLKKLLPCTMDLSGRPVENHMAWITSLEALHDRMITHAVYADEPDRISTLEESDKLRTRVEDRYRGMHLRKLSNRTDDSYISCTVNTSREPILALLRGKVGLDVFTQDLHFNVHYPTLMSSVTQLSPWLNTNYRNFTIRTIKRTIYRPEKNYWWVQQVVSQILNKLISKDEYVSENVNELAHLVAWVFLQQTNRDLPYVWTMFPTDIHQLKSDVKFLEDQKNPNYWDLNFGNNSVYYPKFWTLAFCLGAGCDTQ
jgi:hypothetical protein